MSFFNYLLIIALSVSFFSASPPNKNDSDRCDSLSISHVTERSQNGKYTLTITPKGGVSAYKLFVWDKSGELLSEDFTKREYKNLEAGIYGGIVADANRCSKKFEIIIP